MAAASNAERALLLVRSRRTDGHRPLAERPREVLARQRDNPFLFGSVVGGLPLLAAIGGAFYAKPPSKSVKAKPVKAINSAVGAGYQVFREICTERHVFVLGDVEPVS